MIEEQEGFRAGTYIIVSYVFTLTRIVFLQFESAYNQRVHILYVDLKKVYANTFCETTPPMYVNTILKTKICNSQYKTRVWDQYFNKTATIFIMSGTLR